MAAPVSVAQLRDLENQLKADFDSLQQQFDAWEQAKDQTKRPGAGGGSPPQEPLSPPLAAAAGVKPRVGPVISRLDLSSISGQWSSDNGERLAFNTTGADAASRAETDATSPFDGVSESRSPAGVDQERYDPDPVATATLAPKSAALRRPASAPRLRPQVVGVPAAYGPQNAYRRIAARAQVGYGTIGSKDAEVLLANEELKKKVEETRESIRRLQRDPEEGDPAGARGRPLKTQPPSVDTGKLSEPRPRSRDRSKPVQQAVALLRTIDTSTLDTEPGAAIVKALQSLTEASPGPAGPAPVVSLESPVAGAPAAGEESSLRASLGEAYSQIAALRNEKTELQRQVAKLSNLNKHLKTREKEVERKEKLVAQIAAGQQAGLGDSGARELVATAEIMLAESLEEKGLGLLEGLQRLIAQNSALKSSPGPAREEPNGTEVSAQPVRRQDEGRWAAEGAMAPEPDAGRPQAVPYRAKALPYARNPSPSRTSPQRKHFSSTSTGAGGPSLRGPAGSGSTNGRAPSPTPAFMRATHVQANRAAQSHVKTLAARLPYR